MTAPAAIRQPEVKRVRASEKAIRAAIKAMQDSGLSVDKLLINGAQIEIIPRGVEAAPEPQKDRRLKEW